MKKCLICGNDCKRIYCSYECYWKSKKGKPSWNKGTKGVMRSNKTSFKKGHIMKRKNSDNWKIINCTVCKKEFKEVFSRLRNDRGKYCSRECANIGKKGFIPWNKDMKFTVSQKSKLNMKGLKKGWGWNKGLSGMKDEKHPLWKGDDVGYYAIHSWIQRKLGKPNKCDKCMTTKAKRFEWANISGNYKRSFDDWKRLCSKCHANEHKNWEVRWHVI